MIVLTNGKKAFPEEIEFLINHIPGIKESIVWGDTTTRENVDICAKIVVSPDDLSEALKKDEKAQGQYFAEQLKLVSMQMPPYKVIKYFILTQEDLIKTTTLKVRRPVENTKILSKLAELNLTMKTASGTYID